jgi:hypothetical protein
MSSRPRSSVRSLLVASLTAALLAACAGSPTSPEHPAGLERRNRFQLDSLVPRIDPRGLVLRGLDSAAVRIDSVDTQLLVDPIHVLGARLVASPEPR